ncbi:MAG: hypothetical protein QW638_07840 [Candidatus Bathyarchaeia archaeon]
MIALDTSIFVDSIIPFNRARHGLTSEILSTISRRGLKIHEPKVLMVELSGILVR